MALRRPIAVSIAVVVLATVVSASDPVPSDEEVMTMLAMIEAGDFEGFVAYFQERWPPEPPELTPTALGEKIRAHEPGCLDLARAALTSDDREMAMAAIAALGDYGFEEARAILREAMLDVPPIEPARLALERAWVASFIVEFQDQAGALASQQVQDAGSSSLDRSLHLRVLAYAKPPPSREFYRPFLADPAPELRRAAVAISGSLWDHDALPILLVLENDTDPGVRQAARQLVRPYLIWGPHRPSWRDRMEANDRPFTPYDRDGLRAWRARKPEWERRQRELLAASAG